LSAMDSLEEAGIGASVDLLAEGVSVDLPDRVQASLEDFADLTGLAVELFEVGERRSAMDILALSCTALRESIEAIRDRLGTPVLPANVPPITELAKTIGAEGLYRLAFSATALALGDPSARLVLESFLESAGVPGARGLADPDLAASALAYLALSFGAVLEAPS